MLMHFFKYCEIVLKTNLTKTINRLSIATHNSLLFVSPIKSLRDYYNLYFGPSGVCALSLFQKLIGLINPRRYIQYCISSTD